MKNALLGIFGLLLGSLVMMGAPEQATAALIINGPEDVSVSAVGDAFTINYSCPAGTAGCDSDVTLTGASTWTVTSLTATSITFGISISNNTVDPFSTTNRITEFAVKVLTPDLNTATATNSGSTTAPNPSWTAVVDSNFPSFMQVALKLDDPQAGGASGVFESQTDTLSLVLTGGGAGTNLTTSGLRLQIFPIKYQGAGAGGDSFEFGGTTTPAPEPATIALLGGGLLGLFGAVRRRRRLA